MGVGEAYGAGDLDGDVEEGDEEEGRVSPPVKEGDSHDEENDIKGTVSHQQVLTAAQILEHEEGGNVRQHVDGHDDEVAVVLLDAELFEHLRRVENNRHAPVKVHEGG